MTDPLDAILSSARSHGEVVVHVPPFGFELIPIDMSAVEPYLTALARNAAPEES